MIGLTNIYQVFDFSNVGTTFTEMLNKINSFTDVGQGGVFGIFILIVVFVPLWMMMRSYGNERTFAVAGLITGFIGILLAILHLISGPVLYLCIILSVVGIILLLKEAANYEQ